MSTTRRLRGSIGPHLLYSSAISMTIVRLEERPGRVIGAMVRALALSRGDNVAAAAYLMAADDAPSASAARVIKSSIGAVSPEALASALLPAGRDLSALVRSGGSAFARLVALGARRVPFRVRLVEQTAGARAQFVGAGAAAPLSSGGYLAEALPVRKVVALVAQVAELLRADRNLVDGVLAGDLSDAVAHAMDTELLDFALPPTDDGPGGLGYGLAQIASSGSTVAAIDSDLGRAQRALTDNGHSLAAAAWLMHSSTLSAMQAMRSGGLHAWPSLHLATPQLLGRPVLATPAAPMAGSPDQSAIALVDASSVRFADDDGIDIAVTKYATLRMDDAPTADANTGAGENVTSLYQTDSFAVRATRFVNWRMGRSSGIVTLTGVTI